MHSAEGWLPHLQYEQEKPIREIYRHTTRDEMLSLIDRSGFLSLSRFFDEICRPALKKASKKDGNSILKNLLSTPDFGYKDFIVYMEDKHDYIKSFEGMRSEFQVAKEKMNLNIPTYWMETLDDLMYCLNFHPELISAEDYLFFRKKLMPFLMSVIAALPLSSAHILLALYEARGIKLKTGMVEIRDEPSKNGKTLISVSNTDIPSEKIEYDMFVNCAGQGHMEFDHFPFPDLKNTNQIRKARTAFVSDHKFSNFDTEEEKENLYVSDHQTYLYTGGIDIDSGYRIIDSKGHPSSFIYDVSFIHASGCRPTPMAYRRAMQPVLY